MQIYRARVSLVWGWLAVGVGAAVGVGHIASAGLAHAHGGLGLGAAMAALGAAAFLRPHVAVTEHGVEMHNITQVAAVPFSRLEALDTRWTLEARGDDGQKAGAFAAPAPGASQSRRIERHVAREQADGLPPLIGRAGDAEGTPSGDAAAMVRNAWEAWRVAHPEHPGAGPGDGPDAGSSVTRHIDPIGLGLVVAGALAAIWGLFL